MCMTVPILECFAFSSPIPFRLSKRTWIKCESPLSLAARSFRSRSRPDKCNPSARASMKCSSLFCCIYLFSHLIISFFLLLGCFRPFVFGGRVEFAHRMFGAVVATRSERFALHVCSLHRVSFLKTSLHSYLLILVNLLKRMELLLRDIKTKKGKEYGCPLQARAASSTRTLSV